MAICYATSYPFGFLSRIKRTPLEILKIIVTTLRNQGNKFSFLWVDEDEVLARYSEFMKTCHNINIIVQATGVYASSLNGKIERPNKKLANITRYLILKSINKKEL